MEVGQPSAAPAQPVASPNPDVDQAAAAADAPATALDAAVGAKDFSQFRAAKRAEESGTPLAAPAAPAAEPKPVSRRQQQINDYERRLAAQDAELARLRSTTGAPVAPPAAPRSAAPPASPAAAPVSADDPEPTEATFEHYSDFVKAQARWAGRQEFRAQQAAHSRATAQHQQAQSEHVRRTKFSEAIQATATADPTFLERVSPDVLALKPFAALAPDEAGGPLNAIAEELLDSAVAPQLMLHFSEHPEDLRRLSTLAPRELIREFGRLEARLEKAAAAPASTPIPKTVPGAPPPPATLGARGADPSDPLESAVKRGDFGAFRAAKRAQAR